MPKRSEESCIWIMFRKMFLEIDVDRITHKPPIY